MRQTTFEIALHRWDKWLDSIAYGREVLRLRGPKPPLEEMRGVASKALTELGFPQCTLLELYWLCCVLADYDTQSGFKFEKLFLPDWFSVPFGFKDEEFIDKKFLDLKGGRIKPPIVWTEADRIFHFAREPIAHYLPLEIRLPDFQHYPKKDFIIVLPSDHAIHHHVSRGRPRKTSPDGETWLPHKALSDTWAPVQEHVCQAKPVAPTKCSHCSANFLLWDDEDKLYKCLLCGRAVAVSYNSG